MLWKVLQVIVVVTISSYFGITNGVEKAKDSSAKRVALCEVQPEHESCLQWNKKVSEIVVYFDGTPELPFTHLNRQTMYAASEE